LLPLQVRKKQSKDLPIRLDFIAIHVMRNTTSDDHRRITAQLNTTDVAPPEHDAISPANDSEIEQCNMHRH